MINFVPRHGVKSVNLEVTTLEMKTAGRLQTHRALRIGEAPAFNYKPQIDEAQTINLHR